MIELKDFLSVLPRYEHKNTHGRKGDVKFNYRFRFGNVILQAHALTKEIIENSYVFNIFPCNANYGYSTISCLMIECKDRRE